MVGMAPMLVKETYGSQSVLLEKQVAEIERAVRVAFTHRRSIVATKHLADRNIAEQGKSCWVNEAQC
jgi:hypothetical protein